MPAPVPPPALGAWSRTWRYVVVVLVALLVWVVVAWDTITAGGTREVPPAGDDLVVGVVLALDGLLGLGMVALLPLRRSHPVLVAGVTTAVTAVSGAAVAAAALAIVSLATRRRWREVVGVAAVLLGATLAYELLYRPATTGPAASVVGAAGSAGLALLVVGALVATGSFVGARRELLVRLRERAETAERQRAVETEAAREAERLRIAREMHDVLAHRISLVGLHAGALAYRTDLSREETAQVATVVQENAHVALEELREVLGVLRSGGGTEQAEGVEPGRADEAAEPPQPTLAELPALVADARDAGQVVTWHADLAPGTDLRRVPVTASRTAFRVVQEGLTNARRHAPGAPVDVLVTTTPSGALEVRVGNPAPVTAGAHGADVPAPTGWGLTGLRERAALAGGRLEAGRDEHGLFVLALHLPGGAA